MADETKNGSKFDLKTIATIASLVVMASGVAGSWYTNKAAVAELQEDYTKLEDDYRTYKEKTDERIMDMKIEITSSTSDIKSIKEDVGEIKSDVKTLLRGPE